MSADAEGQVSRTRRADEARRRQRISCRRPIVMNEVEFLEALGRRLATLRRQAGLTQRGLGFRAALSESQIYRIESGTRRALFTVYAPEGVGEQTVRNHLEDIRDNVLLVAPEARTEELDVVGTG